MSETVSDDTMIRLRGNTGIAMDTRFAMVPLFFSGIIMTTAPSRGEHALD